MCQGPCQGQHQHSNTLAGYLETSRHPRNALPLFPKVEL